MRSSTDIIYVMALLAGMSLLVACGGSPTCETEGSYQLSQSGKRIEAPGDLDDLQSFKETTIPRPSPRPPDTDTDTDRCVEMPPVVSTE